MTKGFSILVLLALSFPALADDDDPEPPAGGAELRKLKGSWNVEKVLLPDRELKAPRPMTYKFHGNKLTMDMGKGQTTYTIKLDKQKKPPVLVLTPEQGNATRKMSFEVVKDTLHLGMGATRGTAEPPSTFDGKTGAVMVLTRQKK